MNKLHNYSCEGLRGPAQLCTQPSLLSSLGKSVPPAWPVAAGVSAWADPTPIPCTGRVLPGMGHHPASTVSPGKRCAGPGPPAGSGEPSVWAWGEPSPRLAPHKGAGRNDARWHEALSKEMRGCSPHAPDLRGLLCTLARADEATKQELRLPGGSCAFPSSAMARAKSQTTAPPRCPAAALHQEGLQGAPRQPCPSPVGSVLPCVDSGGHPDLQRAPAEKDGLHGAAWPRRRDTPGC